MYYAVIGWDGPGSQSCNAVGSIVTVSYGCLVRCVKNVIICLKTNVCNFYDALVNLVKCLCIVNNNVCNIRSGVHETNDLYIVGN